MSADPPETPLARLREFVTHHIGLHFPKERSSDLERGIRAAAAEFGFANPDECIEWLLSTPLSKQQIEVLASHLTVGETYFFRDKQGFQALEQHILPELVQARAGEKRLRIWSAGCCTGEEPYSLAVVLGRLLPNIADWQVTLLATDINPRFLQKAAAGVFGEWSFRETPALAKERYFRSAGPKRYELLPEIRKLVTFSYLNLAEDTYPSLANDTNAMDVILCRNVLMYFEPSVVRRVVQNFYRCLADDGFLLVSASEASHLIFSDFETVNFPGAVFYRKPRAGVPAKVSGVELLTSMFASPRFPGAEPLASAIPIPLPQAAPPKAPKPAPVPAAAKPAAAKETARDVHAEALALFERGLYAQAGAILDEAVAAAPKNPGLLALWARVCANEGKLSDALRLCERAIAADKLNSGFHYLRASILLEQGAVDDAAAALRRALYLDQNFVLAHFALGNLARRQGKRAEARKHLENARQSLRGHSQDEILPESDGITAGRLSEVIALLIQQQTAA
jgi:chemotaxis protein methyltransferase CheR